MTRKRRRGDGDGEPAPGADALLALPAAEFTGARDALAAERAAAGDRAGADAVRKLRRPVGLAWILNALAGAEPRGVAALLDAGDTLRAGQRAALEGKGGAGLRAGEDALRVAARALREKAAPLLAGGGRAVAPQTLARVELLLRLAATGDEATRDALRRGRLSREPGPGAGEGPFVAGAAEAATPARPSARGKGALRRAEREDAVRARTEAKRAQRVERERERMRAAAAKALARAEAELERRRKALAAAEDAIRAARSRLATAEAEVARRRAALAAAERGR